MIVGFICNQRIHPVGLNKKFPFNYLRPILPEVLEKLKNRFKKEAVAAAA